jgi:hypothetical protein
MAGPPLAVEIAGPLTGALALSLLKRWSTLDNGPQMSLPRKVVKPANLSCRRERGVRSASLREEHTPVPGASILIRQSRSRSVYLQEKAHTIPDSVIPGVCRTDRRPTWQDQP